jgi:hypothetical protein
MSVIRASLGIDQEVSDCPREHLDVSGSTTLGAV